MAVFDATTLLVLLAPNVSTVTDSNGAQITYARERVDGFVKDIISAYFDGDAAQHAHPVG